MKIIINSFSIKKLGDIVKIRSFPGWENGTKLKAQGLKPNNKLIKQKRPSRFQCDGLSIKTLFYSVLSFGLYTLGLIRPEVLLVVENFFFDIIAFQQTQDRIFNVGADIVITRIIDG